MMACDACQRLIVVVVVIIIIIIIMHLPNELVALDQSHNVILTPHGERALEVSLSEVQLHIVNENVAIQCMKPAPSCSSRVVRGVDAAQDSSVA